MILSSVVITLSICTGIINTVSVAALLLNSVHCHICVLDKFIKAGYFLGKNSDADTNGNDDFLFWYIEWKLLSLFF